VKQPGDRYKTQCRGCKAEILMITTTRLKTMPCELGLSPVDGKKLLIFGDGYVGMRHGDDEAGHESHFSHCPNAEQFRGKAAAKEPEQRKLF